MNDQQNPLTKQNTIIQLEVLPEDELQPDIADIDEVGRNLFEQLRKDGYTVNPARTGKKGGGPLLDILLQIPEFLHDNKDLLLAMFDSVTLVLQCLFIVRDQRTEKEKIKQAPLKFTLLIDGRPLTIETADAKDAVKLIEQFQRIYSEEAKTVTTQSNLKIEARVPKKRRRGSH